MLFICMINLAWRTGVGVLILLVVKSNTVSTGLLLVFPAIASVTLPPYIRCSVCMVASRNARALQMDMLPGRAVADLV
jgi:hypothetical protein